MNREDLIMFCHASRGFSYLHHWPFSSGLQGFSGGKTGGKPCATSMVARNLRGSPKKRKKMGPTNRTRKPTPTILPVT